MPVFFSTELIMSSRIAAQVEYDGASYFGWQIQRQPLMPSVQAEVERALSVVANHPVQIFCAGRTDSGVHGTGQIIHFESSVLRSEKSWVFGANVNLPGNIALRWVKGVTDDFHARFSATARTYRYIILNSPVKSAILQKKVVQFPYPLDVAAMQEAGQYLLGENDFSSYRGAGCQSNTPFRFVEAIQVYRQGDFIITEITANAFLLHMVRNIMGVLMEIGRGGQSPLWAKQVLEARDRKKAGKTAPPEGLYLVRAHYPEHFGLPQLPLGPAFIQNHSVESYRQN
jgi:tRNA pseudouridine38-40 synthase